MSYVQQCYVLPNGANFQYTLPRECAKITFIAQGEVRLRVDKVAPAKPGSDPAPSDATIPSNYLHLKTAGDFITVGFDDAGRGAIVGEQDTFLYVTGWSYGANELQIVGH